MNNNLQICRFSNLKSFTAKVFLTFALQIVSQQMFGQLFDDFSDGDFTNSPEWSGLDSKFVVESRQLKLQALPVNDFAYLTTPSKAINHASWEFLVSLEFNPSSTNFARIYLVSDQPNLHDLVNGYFVQLGNTTDDVSLYKQSGDRYTKIIDGVDKRLDLPTITIRIKVSRDAGGLWELLVDVGSNGTYVSEGTMTDTTHSSSQYFGIFCTYTSARSDKFHFDDFVVTGSPSHDNTPPTMDSMTVASSNELLLTFSEILDTETSQNITHYSVDHSIAHPTNASISENKRVVKLSFDVGFLQGVPYTIDISGISDVAGNFMIPAIRKFRYLPPTPGILKDIIFTEILADPSPKIGLPEVEFVELFNRSQTTYNLDGWKVTDESSLFMLPALVLAPGEYLIIAPSADEFSGYGNVWAANDFPSLNNSGDILQIRDINDLLVDSINYSNSWYKDDDRSSGGWSLELIDPDNLCSDSENWTVSDDPAGGTPGKQNSVFANKPDLTGPILQSVFPSNSTSLRLTFNERLEKLLPDVTSFTLDPAIEITMIAFTDQSLTQLQLSLANELQPGVIYSIHVGKTYDCSGNSIDPNFNKMFFGLPETAQAADIVINEILFNPKPGGVDFIELVNNSHKFLNLKNWSIGIMEDGMPSSIKPLMILDYLLKPGAYLVLTEDFSALKGEYPFLAEVNVLVLDNMPRLNDDKGSVVVIDDQGNIIDYFQYAEDLHSVFIDDEEGVSLERIALDRPTNENQNWKSASSMAGFATPGYPNSNAIDELSLNEETIKIEPEVFIPLAGQPEYAMIRYKFDKGGYVANVKIFDDQGHLIKRVASNEVLGTEGALRWDGDRDNGNPARIGSYMVWFEVFDNNGDVKTLRKRIAIATRFR